MEKNLGVRVTFDGLPNTGRTVLMEAFAAFLREKGFTNITVLHDDVPCEGVAALELLDQVVAQKDDFVNKEIVMIQREVPRGASLQGITWAPMPAYLPQGSPFFQTPHQLLYEMNYHSMPPQDEPAE